MPFTITQFRSEISKQKNLARPNLFEVNVTGKAINNALVPFMAKIASIPNSTMGVVEVPYFGRQVKVPGNRTFDNLSITILNGFCAKVDSGKPENIKIIINNAFPVKLWLKKSDFEQTLVINYVL